MQHTDTTDFWRMAFPYPDDCSPRTIAEDVHLGYAPPDEGGFPATGPKPVGPNLREGNTLLFGSRGSGKTIVLADLIAGALRCPDTLVWTIGDELARLFLRPALDGRIAHPAVEFLRPAVDGRVAGRPSTGSPPTAKR